MAANIIPSIVFLLSIGLQLSAAMAALLLIKITGKKLAWILLSIAMVLMTARRIYSFIAILSAGRSVSFDFSELIALAISILMLIGVLRIKKYFGYIRKTEAALIEERIKSEAIIAAVGYGISIQDTNFKILYENEAHKAMIGDHTGEYCYKAYQQRADVCEGCPLALSFKDGGIHTEQRHLDTPDGRRYFEVTASALKDVKGNIISGIEVVREMTDHIRAEEALRNSEEKYRDLFENATDLIQAVDENGRFMYVNTKWKEVLGYSDGDIKHLTLMDILHKDMIPHCMQLFEKLKKGTPILNLETIFTAKDGRNILVEGNISAKIKDGNFISTRGIFRDITVRKQTEEFIKHIFGSIDEGLAVISPDMKIITANPAYCNQAGISLEEIQAKRCYEISHHIYKPCYEAGEECPVRHTFETGDPHTATHMHFEKEGNLHYIEIKAFPMKDEAGRVTSVIEIFNDVTEKTMLETQLRHSQKIEAIGTLAGGIAHDFNNILSAIIGYGHLVIMKMKDDDPLKHHVEQILHSAERAANLTQGLLAFSRKQMISPLAVNINDIIKKAEKLLSRLLTENIELKTLLSDIDLTVLVDPTSLEQVLINLCTNSRDAMPDGGALTIETGIVAIDGEYIRVHGYGKKGRYALISVTDTGSGMDKKTREKIFEPFFTTKEVGKGTGLGLAIVYGIIKQHNGYINCYSELGKGTTFRIYLPLSKYATDSEERIMSVEAIPKGKETILIAEDDSDVRRIIMEILQSAGYKIIEASDGEDAVLRFMENKDRIDMIILDVIMPKKSGEKAYEEIMAVKPAIKVIFASGYSPELINKKYLLEERLNFIQKPISPNELINKIRKILER